MNNTTDRAELFKCKCGGEYFRFALKLWVDDGRPCFEKKFVECKSCGTMYDSILQEVSARKESVNDCKAT